MRALRVQSPDGRRWIVRRRWMPRLRGETLWGRFRGRLRGIGRRLRGASEAGDLADGCAGAAVDDLIVVVVAVLALLVLIFVVVPVIVAVVDLLILVVLSVIGVIARVVFRRPWSIEARTEGGRAPGVQAEWRVVGWRAGRQHIAHVAADLQAGRPLTLPAGHERPSV